MRIKELKKIILYSCDDGQASKVTTKFFKVIVNVCVIICFWWYNISCVQKLLSNKCKVTPESPLHALWTCSELNLVCWLWSDANAWDFCVSIQFLDFKELLSWILHQNKNPELFVFTTWSIWTRRNQVRSAQTGCSVDQIAQVYPRIGLRNLTQSSFPNNLAHHSLKFHGSLHLRIVSRLISIEHSSQAVHLNLA